MLSDSAGERDLARFRLQLRQRAVAYFAVNSGGSKGNPRMWLKLVLGFGSYIAALALLLSCCESVLLFWGNYAIFGLAQAYILLNIGHDASHDAITNSRTANRLLRWSLDICGVDSRLFTMSHVEMHHACVNVGVEDEATRARRILRLSPHRQRPVWGRYQHLLVWPTYACGIIDFVLLRDWEMLRHQPGATVHLFLSKSAYVGLTLGLPVLLVPLGFEVVLAGWLLSLLVSGFFVMSMLQLSHLADDAQFPQTLTGSAANPRHVMATTMDIATNSRFLAWTAGGLHQHVAHHLYPGMCHVHYGALTGIITNTAAECGLRYRCHHRFSDAVASHMHLLKRLGSARGAELS